MPELKYYEPDRLYCSTIFVSLSPTVINTSIVMIATETLISVGDLCLFFYNKYQIKQYRRLVFLEVYRSLYHVFKKILDKF